ncbi:rSAM-modified peptide [Flavobacterium poyangense]|nr:rSAM-modified peptide [Flavobacterium sp. JXAS1]
MTKKNTTIEDFQVEKLPKNQQKKVLGGCPLEEDKDPIRGGGNTGGNG